jgi:hypothetical protein
MENNRTPAWKHSFTYGMGTGVVLIAISLILYVMDVNTFENRWIGWVSNIFLFAGMTISAINYRNKELNGYMTYGQSFSVHFLTGLFAGILSGIFMIFFMAFLGDEIKQMAMENAEQEVLKRNPNASDQELEMALKFTDMFTGPAMMGAMTVLSSAFFAAIYGLIASIFVKKEDNSVQTNV